MATVEYHCNATYHSLELSIQLNNLSKDIILIK